MQLPSHTPGKGGRPLVATLVISPFAQDYFNQLRKQHFPPERNYLDAHLTLFHALPDEPGIWDDTVRLARDQEPFRAVVEQIVSLGNGTAFKVVAPPLPMLHQRLQKQWNEVLTAQDKQKRNFHITIQNKVEAAAARDLQAALRADFQPFELEIRGISLWRYLGGPWEFLATFPFGEGLTKGKIPAQN